MHAGGRLDCGVALPSMHDPRPLNSIADLVYTSLSGAEASERACLRSCPSADDFREMKSFKSAAALVFEGPG